MICTFFMAENMDESYVVSSLFFDLLFSLSKYYELWTLESLRDRHTEYNFIASPYWNIGTVLVSVCHFSITNKLSSSYSWSRVNMAATYTYILWQIRENETYIWFRVFLRTLLPNIWHLECHKTAVRWLEVIVHLEFVLCGYFFSVDGCCGFINEYFYNRLADVFIKIAYVNYSTL